MQGAHREIDWETLDGATRQLPETSRAVIGGTWRERMRQEHLAVGAFALLTRELAEQGCDAAVLGLVARASADEVRHAEICRRVAVSMLGEDAVPRAWRGLPKVPPHVESDARTRVLLHVVEMCCLSETLTGVFFTEMHARASHPVARAVVESLLEDEIDHGRVGWAYLAARTRDGTLGGLAEALPSMLDRTFGRALHNVGQVTDDDAMEAFGYVRDGACGAIFRRALRDVVVPGFEKLGVDLSPARATMIGFSAPKSGSHGSPASTPALSALAPDVASGARRARGTPSARAGAAARVETLGRTVDTERRIRRAKGGQTACSARSRAAGDKLETGSASGGRDCHA